MRTIIVALTLLLPVACVPASSIKVQDTKTITNPEATHVWVIQKSVDGNESILYCDSNLHGREQIVCVRPTGQ